MKLAGHLTRSVCDRYKVNSESDLRDAARKLNLSLRRAGVFNADVAAAD